MHTFLRPVYELIDYLRKNAKNIAMCAGSIVTLSVGFGIGTKFYYPLKWDCEANISDKVFMEEIRAKNLTQYLSKNELQQLETPTIPRLCYLISSNSHIQEYVDHHRRKLEHRLQNITK